MIDTTEGLLRPTKHVSGESGRVVVVSNRLPITAAIEDGRVVARPSAGGLATGLKDVARRWPVVWLGWSGLADDDGGAAGEQLRLWRGGSAVPVPLSQLEIARFYVEFCNSTLWPLLHGWTEQTAPESTAWTTYRAVNRRFAEAAVRQARRGDRIWVHDFHLLLVPTLLREIGADAPIAFFLHTPFPEPKVFATLPQSAELLAGVLGADIIGFHTEEYAEHFRGAAIQHGYRLVGDDVFVDGRRVRVRVHPMGIDVDTFTALGGTADVVAKAERIRSGNGFLLVGVDRLDYTKGIPQRLTAFELLLEKQPELIGKVRMLQVAVPSREDVAAYRNLRGVVEALVRRINQRFETRGWTPIHYLYDTLDLSTLGAVYRAADVMVVTPLRDGLNLIAKEFVATRTDGDGVLILSEFAGAAAELQAALLVDPNRTGDLAAAYSRALMMWPAERRLRMRKLRKVVAANSVFDWASDFLSRMPGAARAVPA